MKSRRCAKLTIELVQTGPSLILKFKISKRGLVQFGPTQWWVWHTPYFFPSPPLILSTWLCRKCILSFGGDCMLGEYSSSKDLGKYNMSTLRVYAN